MASEEYREHQREYYRLRRLAFPEHYRELYLKSRPNRNVALLRLTLQRYNVTTLQIKVGCVVRGIERRKKVVWRNVDTPRVIR